MAKDTREADVAFIEALAELLRKNDLSELQVTREYGEGDSLSVRVGRGGGAAPPPPAPAASPAPAAPQSAPAPAAESPPDDPAAHPGAVTSPMVGTVYLAPEPDAAPFVDIGATVEEGQTLMIVEAMKTMNHIPAPKSGTVRRVLIEDGAPVEFGAVLMIVE